MHRLTAVALLAACSQPSQLIAIGTESLFAVNATQERFQADLGDPAAGVTVTTTFSTQLPPLVVGTSTSTDLSSTWTDAVLYDTVSFGGPVPLAALLGPNADDWEVALRDGGADLVDALVVDVVERLYSWAPTSFTVLATCTGTVSLAPTAIQGVTYTVDDVTLTLNPELDRIDVTVVLTDVVVDSRFQVDATVSSSCIVGPDLIHAEGPLKLRVATLTVKGFVREWFNGELGPQCLEPHVFAMPIFDELCATGATMPFSTNTFPILDSTAELFFTQSVAQAIIDGQLGPLLAGAGACGTGGLGMSPGTLPMDEGKLSIADTSVDVVGGSPRVLVSAAWDGDGDGFDQCDVCPESTFNFDPDHDQLCSDNCPYVANPDQADVDGDGLGDACDTCPIASPDADDLCWTDWTGLLTCQPGGDGTDDACDNCPGDYNPSQADTDHDGVGDACDVDIDGDRVLNGDDDCPYVAMVSPNCPLVGGFVNPATCPALGAAQAAADPDGDGVGAACDVCLAVADPEQADLDGDGFGDACDIDLDGDGVSNVHDKCVDTPDADQVDVDEDGIGDACDPVKDCPPGKAAICGEWDARFHPRMDPFACLDGVGCVMDLPPATVRHLRDRGGRPVDRARIALLIGARGAADVDTEAWLWDEIDRSTTLRGVPFDLVDWLARRPGTPVEQDRRDLDRLIERDPAGMAASIALKWVTDQSARMSLGRGGWARVVRDALDGQRRRLERDTFASRRR